MSQQQLTKEAAEGALVGAVRLPAFFEKLARDWNIVPQNEADQQHLLEIASYLRAAATEEHVKQASTGSPFLSSTLNGLREALGHQQPVGYSPEWLKQAADYHIQNLNGLDDAAFQYAAYMASEAATPAQQ